MSQLSARCVETVRAVLDGLDYAVLAEIYCDDGGDAFWKAKRPEVERLGRSWAEALIRRVPAEGRSLYAGAGVVELPVMIAEVLDRDRRVVAANLRSAECDVINAGLSAAGLGERLALQCTSVEAVAEAGAFDHVAAVSLFDDPETWPVVSDVTYGRAHPAELDVERFAIEREEVRRTAEQLFRALRRPGWITTTVEEIAWFLEQAHAVGATVAAEDEMIETALVGDPIGFALTR